MSGGGTGGYDPAALGKTLGGKLTDYVNTPAPVFNKSLNPGVSVESSRGLRMMEGAADPNGYSNSVGGAIADFGDVAAGKRFGMNDPGYAALRAKVGDDTLTGVNSIFSGSGRFGSGSHVENASSELGNVYAGMDYQNYQNDIARQQQAAGMLPGLYAAAQQPGQTTLGVGSLIDQYRSAALQGENDLFQRTQNADYNRFNELMGTFTGTQQNAGMQEETPWWQSLLGVGAQLL